MPRCIPSPIQRDIFQQPRHGWTRPISLLRSPNLFEPLRLQNAPVPVAAPVNGVSLSRGPLARREARPSRPGYGMLPNLAGDTSTARVGSPRAGASIGGSGPALPSPLCPREGPQPPLTRGCPAPAPAAGPGTHRSAGPRFPQRTGQLGNNKK